MEREDDSFHQFWFAKHAKQMKMASGLTRKSVRVDSSTLLEVQDRLKTLSKEC
jgi:hypothetical protein